MAAHPALSFGAAAEPPWAALEARARALGFPTVHAGVFVRSSYGADYVYREGGRR